MIKKKYDVIVVGGGHAGLEASFACAKTKMKVLLITLEKESIGSCPCNPSVGGPAKGIVTREIDALGGMQGIATDENQMQMKLLNESKGAGVRALRAQIDKIKYHTWFLEKVIKQKNLDLLIDEVLSINAKNKTTNSITTKNNGIIFSKYILITTGTYMESKTFAGFKFNNAGPVFDYLAKDKTIKTEVSKRSNDLSENLRKLGFTTIRLKTGTPPRIYSSTIDFKKLDIHKGTDAKLAFEHFNPTYLNVKKQSLCWMTYTNEKTHKIIRENIKKSPMYAGILKSVGPRYCPSIEDKVMRFAEKLRHQLFIEPESSLMKTIYLQGFSTSLPEDVQDKIIRTLPGFNNCKIQRYAYAIEYDAIEPTQLKPTLESKIIKNLYFAGQVNGTSGYEEAAGQGLLAGLNISLSFQKKKPLILKRSESYIGVMIDDIVTKGVNDPYRLLTSRAEYRLTLRNDNADERLIHYGKYCGLVTSKNWSIYKKNMDKVNRIITFLKNTSLTKNQRKEYGNSNHSLFQLLKRPEINLIDVISKDMCKNLSPQIIEKIEIKTKFEGYLVSQQKTIDKYNKLENFSLENICDYKKIKNLSLEAIAKLNKIKPININQAQRIQGLTSNDIISIKFYLDKNK